MYLTVYQWLADGGEVKCDPQIRELGRKFELLVSDAETPALTRDWEHV